MFLIYFLFWVIFNGNITWEICILGVIIAAIMFAFTCKFMDYSVEMEKKNVKRVFLFIKYVAHLIIEVIKANYATVKMILSQKEEIEPALVSFRSDLKTPVGKTLLANAITLTPGTITVSLEGDKYVVHCLDKDMAEGIDENMFEDFAREIENK